MEILGKFEILEYFENFETVGGKLWRREGYMRPKLSILGGLLALPTETSFTTPHYYPKYEVWVIEFFCGRIPLSHMHKLVPGFLCSLPRVS